MARKLLLFIQSDNPKVYTNVLTHCVQIEGVRDIYFAVNGGAVGRISEAKNKIKKIKKQLEDLLEIHSHYKLASDFIPPMTQVDEKIIRVLFTNPALSVREIKHKIPDFRDLIVDVSGCSKKVSSDIISSYIASGINHVCCFELDDKVYSQEWRQDGLSNMYHDIRGDIVYYEYIDFSDSGNTIESFNRMRSQGVIIQCLFAISIILGILVIILIQQQQNVFAQYAALLLALVTGLGLFNDVFGLVDRLR